MSSSPTNVPRGTFSLKAAQELSEEHIGELLEPYVGALSAGLLPKLRKYLDLLLHWNARTNLTAIRDPSQIITRHFGESLFAAATLSPLLPESASLLDFGSGAGFPGIPIQLFRPDLHVTLAESQHKKAAFLREVVRTLELPTSVHGARVNTLPTQKFDCITLRAVDNMSTAIFEATPCLRAGGLLARMTTTSSSAPQGLLHVSTYEVPCSRQEILTIHRADARG